jgi:hypothetical protein
LRRSATDRELWLDVSGASMGRAIVPPAQVHVIPGGRPRRGEIWAFCLEDAAVVVHRLRDRRDGTFLFQGDAMAVPDAPVPPERLIGRVRQVRSAGTVHDIGAVDRWRGFAAISWRRLRRRVLRLAGRPRRGRT